MPRSMLRTNPLSFIVGRDFVFQVAGQIKALRLNRDLWGTLASFYQLPSLAPHPREPTDIAVQQLVTAGILVPESETESVLRRERSVHWCGDKTMIHFLLATRDLDAQFWFEHNGRTPLAFFHRGGGPVASSGSLNVHDGHSFGSEAGGAYLLARNKAATHTVLACAGYPVPPQIPVPRWVIPQRATAQAKQRLLSEVLQQAPPRFRFPAVIKPADQSLGIGVEFADDTEQMVTQLVRSARQLPHVSCFVVETRLAGREWRVTVFEDGSHVAYARIPFRVTGDGDSTIRELVRRENARRKSIVRERRYLRVPSRLSLRLVNAADLAARGISLNSRLERGRRLKLVQRAHGLLGGLLQDATDRVRPETLDMLREIRQQMGLTRAGFDLMGSSIGNGLRILEVNSRPHLWPHIEPDRGKPRHAARTMLRVALASPLSPRSRAEILRACSLARKVPLV